MLGVFLAMTLIPKSEKENTLKWVTQGVSDSAAIIAITGAGGSFGAILSLLPIADATTGLLASGLGVIVPFLIAMINEARDGRFHRRHDNGLRNDGPAHRDDGLRQPAGPRPRRHGDRRGLDGSLARERLLLLGRLPVLPT